MKPRYSAAGGLLLAAAVLLTSSAYADDAVRREAELLYAKGRYSEAHPLLKQLDEAGASDGSLLYRLAYCQRLAGDESGSADTQERARAELEAELDSAKAIEVPFYLANTYQNLGRTADLQRVAKQATGKIERGEYAAPRTGNEMFQTGKLYADLGNETAAVEWYSRSVSQLTEEGDTGGPYTRWAARYLAERAYRNEDFSGAEQHYSQLIAAGEGQVADLDRLAVARIRQGMYEEAATAWKQAELLRPADADRARYSGKLAEMAAQLGDLAQSAPSGKDWAEMDKPGIETLMRESADEARAKRVEAMDSDDDAQRARLRGEIEAIQQVFVAAALEYVARGHSIREAAFFGGYAPLVFHQRDWRVPRNDREREEHQKKKKSTAGRPGRPASAP